MRCRSLLLSALLPLALVGGGRAREDRVPAAAAERPVAREVAAETFTGRTEAVQTVELRARVTGYLTEVRFKEGAEVKKGQALFEIDPRPYKAQLDQALGKLNLAKAQLRLAQSNYARDRALAAKAPGTVSAQQLDQDAAAVEEASTRLKAAEASTEVARLNLELTRVRAPIDGRIGRSLITIGNLVIQDQTLLATIVSKDPIYAYFDMDERTFLRFRREELAGKRPKGPLAAQVGLADEKGFPRKGTVDFVNNVVNPRTGTVQLRVVLPNADGLLVPGMFVRVRLSGSAPRKAPDPARR